MAARAACVARPQAMQIRRYQVPPKCSRLRLDPDQTAAWPLRLDCDKDDVTRELALA